MQGIMKKMPGPLAPPLSRRPRRKMTTRSYSCTTLMQKNRESGKVAITKSNEKAVRKMAHTFVGSPEVAAVGVGERERKRSVCFGEISRMHC